MDPEEETAYFIISVARTEVLKEMAKKLKHEMSILEAIRSNHEIMVTMYRGYSIAINKIMKELRQRGSAQKNKERFLP